MKGFCKYGSRLCPYTHPGVCSRWKAGKCSDPCSQNLLHQELPRQYSPAAVAQFQADFRNQVAKAQAKKKQKSTKKKSSSRSSSRASSNSTRNETSMGATKKKKKTKQTGSDTKKTDGHKPKQGPQ